MKVISKIAIVFALGLLVSAGLSNVFATCGVPGTTFTCNYYDAPIGQDVLATAGTFWGIGQFNPASPGGTDNGLTLSSSWLRYTPGLGFYLAGDWAGDIYDGCIQDPPNPQPARMGAVWTTSDGTDSYFVALCATEETAGGTFGTFTDIPGTAMTQVPKPRINASSRAGGITSLTVGLEPSVGGVYNTGGCTLAITGFKIYQQTVPRNAPAPSASRNPGAGWVLLGQGTESTADVAGDVNCAVDSDVYLMSTLLLDGNVELKQGSRNATKVECGPNIAVPEGGDDFRFIRKPKNAKGR